MAQLSDDAFAFGGDLMRIEDALSLVSARIPPIAETERVALAEADGRIVARSVIAPIDLPVFDNSAVDGYAVAHADLDPDAATLLPLAGRITAGQIVDREAARGTAVRIFTGAPMPAATDTVFMQEDVRLLEDGRVELPCGLARGANCRAKGEDIARGDEALAAGRRLEPRDIALAAALGLAHLEVRRRPRVAVFSTGDEICDPGTPLGPAAIYDSNRYALTALLRRCGCEVTDLGILRDNRDAIQAGLSTASQAHDLVVTSGGVSTGEEDHVRAAIAGRGSMVFWRLAIKPGRPVAMGVINGTPLVGLPGNPVAVFVTFAYVLRPLIAAMAGAVPTPLIPSTVMSGFSYRKKAGRREYVRVSLERRGAQTVATKYPVDGAGVITSLTRTDGLIELGEDRLSVEPGEPVPFIDYRQLT
jgi:molybdopterin molybdotransferase